MRELFYIARVVWHARKLQNFLWGESDKQNAGKWNCQTYNQWMKNLEYRLKCLESVDMSNPSWKVETRKRALQMAGISIAFITAINNGTTQPNTIDSHK